MNKPLTNLLKISAFKQDLIRSTKRKEISINIKKNKDAMKLLTETVNQMFNGNPNEPINISTSNRTIGNEFIDGQIKQQEQFLRLMGFPDKWDNVNFISPNKEVSQRAHFKYLREPINSLGEVGCCNFDENGQTSCFKYFGMVLRKGPAFEDDEKGFCMCCTREIVNSIFLRQFILKLSSTGTLNKFRYKYNMKSDYGNNKKVLTIADTKYLIDPRYKERISSYFKHEDMTDCDEYEYPHGIGYVQESDKNFGLVGFYPLFHKSYFKKCDHRVIICNEDLSKAISIFKTSGLQEIFFSHRSSKDR